MNQVIQKTCTPFNKVIRGKSEGTFKEGIALNFSSTQET